jgi:hypothetical protein
MLSEFKAWRIFTFNFSTLKVMLAYRKMNFGSRIYKAVLAVVAAGLFCGVAQVQNLLNNERKELGFTVLEPLENAPPFLAFTSVALGGFRGLISNFLWIRAGELQEQERFFEMVQLSDWISKLEPHFATVWTHQAWNMAFNISVKCKDPAERWRWVQRGIQLDMEGLRYNPGETLIYKDLSWMFRFKIGQNLDDAHMFYKRSWAQEMQDVLGGHPDFPALLHPQTPEEVARVKKLREQYQMDPAVIQEIDTNYGPLDWRLPGAHALYWAEMGERNGNESKDKDILKRFNAQVLQQVCFYQGALPPWVTKVTPQNFILWPDLDMVTNVISAYERATFSDDAQKQTSRTAEKNFLKDAVVSLYEFNRDREAAHWFNYMKQNFTNALLGAEVNMNYEDYALKQIGADINDLDPNKGTSLVLGLLYREYVQLIEGDDDAARTSSIKAHEVWNNYESRLPPGPDANKKRIELPPFAKLAGDEYDYMMRRVPPEAAARLHARVGVDIPIVPSATNAPSADVSK